MKRQATDSEQIFPNHITNKIPGSRIFKELKAQNKKISKTWQKLWTKNVYEWKIHENCSTSQSIIEIQIKL